MTNAERFANLFRGYELRHGRYDIQDQEDTGKYTGRARTVNSSIAPEDYEAHLSGKYGIGIIPLTEDDTVHFAAIDVDKYSDLDHYDFAVRLRQLPVVLSRSKSNGLHIWLFSKDGVTATTAVEFLKNLAGQLGFGGCEIFPKQTTRASREDTGNWINLPYFGDSRTAVLVRQHEDGRMVQAEGTLDEFLAAAEACAEMVTSSWLADFNRQLKTERADADSSEDWYDGPPCLQLLFVGDKVKKKALDKKLKDGKLTQEEYDKEIHSTSPQLAEGGRNIAFFNAGQYLYRKYGDENTVQDKLIEVNIRSELGLPRAEIETLSKQSKKEWSYQCNQEPLCGLCQRSLCRRRKFGVGSNAADIPVELGGFTKINTDPPQYAFNADGVRVRLDAAGLLNQRKFAEAILDAATKIWPTLQDAKFKELLSKWWATADIIEGPPDSDRRSIVRRALLTFIQERQYTGANRERFFTGAVLWNEDETEAWFEITHFRRFLMRDRLYYEPRELANILLDLGVTYRRQTTTIASKTCRPWIVHVPELMREDKE